MKSLMIALGTLTAIACGVFVATLLSHDKHPQLIKLGHTPKDGDESKLIQVGDKVITRRDVDHELGLLQRNFVDLGGPEIDQNDPDLQESLKKKILETLVERKILLSYVEQDTSFDTSKPERLQTCHEDWRTALEGDTGPIPDELVAKLRERLCDQSIVAQYVSERITGPLTVSEQETRRFHRQNPALFTSPVLATVRHLVTGDERSAQRLRTRIRAHNFAKLAKEHSMGPEAKDGGLLPPFARGELPQLFNVAFQMKKGQISPVIKSTYGFHIIMLVDRAKAGSADYARAKNQAQRLLLEEKKKKEYKRWVDLALHSVKIKVTGTL